MSGNVLSAPPSVAELLLRLHLEEFDRHFARVKEEHERLVWVSAVTQCPRKWYYTLRVPQLARTYFRGSFVLGRAAHIGIQRLLVEYAHELGYDRVEVEVPVEKRVVLDNGREVVLSGRVDAIGYRGSEKMVYEIKTGRSDTNIPYENHILQLRVYMNMLEAGHGILLYITPDRVTEFHVDNPISDEELRKLVEEFLEYKGPRYDWECNYCPYAVICPYKKTSTSGSRNYSK